LKGIILHGGFGTRLRPFTYTMPKQLLPIANKPMSQYCIEVLREAEITEIAIIIGGDNSSKVQEYYGDGTNFDVKLTYIHQDEPKGISHAIGLCQDFVNNEKFIVFLGDNILKKNILEFKKNFEKSNSDATILLCEVDNPTQFGIVDIQGNIIKQIIEKPKNPPSNFAVIGVYFLSPIIFEIIKKLKPSWRNELEITDALQILLVENGKIHYETVTEFWKDTGTPSDILNANRAILECMESYFHGIVKDEVKQSGNIMVGEGSILDNGVEIIGPVIIGKNCRIHGCSCIGPNVSIGDNCNILNTRIDNSIIMSNTKIEQSKKISNSIIAYNSQILSKDDTSVEYLLGEDSKIFKSNITPY
jgi:glucose-1-phosphate thymidylyltransferase